MKKIANHVIGLTSGIVLLILSSFVPTLFSKVMKILESGAAIDLLGSIVIGYLALLGAAMYVCGHFFHAYNKKVSKDFESWFK
jgi:uncharacterized YccA/Bax inhibitor family protein